MNPGVSAEREGLDDVESADMGQCGFLWMLWSIVCLWSLMFLRGDAALVEAGFETTP